MVTRHQILKKLATMVPDDVLVVAQGNSSWMWWHLTQSEATLVGVTMGMCTPTALGLALALPKSKVLSLDGDGNLLLNLGTLGTVANQDPANLIIIVFDNENYLGSHKDAPGMPTASSGKFDFAGVAKASGIASACTISSVEEFEKRIETALSTRGPHFIVAKVEPLDTDRPLPTRPVPDSKENKYRFAAYIERREGIKTPGGSPDKIGWW